MNRSPDYTDSPARGHRSQCAPPRYRFESLLTPLPVIAIGLTCLLLAMIVSNRSPYLRGPAPGPQEWRWHLRQDVSLQGLPGVIGFSAALAGLIGISVTRPAARRPRLIGGILLAATALSSFGLHFSLIAMEDGRSATDILVKRTISPSFTSYHTVAVDPICHDVGEFVQQHVALLPQLPYHAHTHPLGPILYYRGHLHLLQRHPGLADAVLRFASRLGVDPRLLSEPDQELPLATAVTGVLLLVAMSSSLSCITVAALARAIGFPIQGAVRTAIIWAVVPGFALMVPEFDRFLVAPLTAATALLVIAFRPTTSRVCRALASIGAGVMAGLAMHISYGAAIFLVYGGLVAIAVVLPSRPKLLSHLLVPICAAAAVSALLFFLPTCFGHDSIGALRTATQIHRLKATKPRSYTAWIIFNLWDSMVFLGFPLAVFWVYRAGSSILSIFRGGFAGATGPALTCAAATAGVLLIDLAGVVRGEAGRIWLPLMPFLLISALGTESPEAQGEENKGSKMTAPWALTHPGLVFVLLVVCCLVLRSTWHIP